MSEHKLVIPAEPDPLTVDLRRMAVLVIDMQNAFASKGGMLDLSGLDISNVATIIEPIKNIIDVSRAQGIRVIYIAHRLSPDLREIGPLTPYAYNKMEMEVWHKKPDMRNRIILRGTWGAEIIDELKPQPTEIVIEKKRFSAFAGTELDMTLRTFGVKYLVFTGVTTNVCVESSLRDAYHLDYFPILLSDATVAPKPAMYEATIANVRQVFGWVTTTTRIIDAIEQSK
jgi:ureidoacrylate peracid hydrolase